MIDNPDKLSVYIGNDDMIDWALGIGKPIVMAELLRGSKKLIDSNLSDLECVTIVTDQPIANSTYKFIITSKKVHITLARILDWYEENEEYEICAHVKELQNKLKNEKY